MGELSLIIPTLGIQAPIVGVPLDGTDWDITWLGKDAGWLESSAFPSWNGNSVLTGHVYNADGTPGIFVDLGNLIWGDRITIKLQGQSYIFEVREVRKKVDPSNLEAVMAHQETPWLTLITCQGYDASSNTYRWRIMVRAVLIKVK
jgi:LPXTG-site transpeptidase (sortase) family protein